MTKITALVENTAHGECTAIHGLSLYIETPEHKLLFDLGPNETLFANAQKCGVDLSLIDTVILSHGHKDHGGALKRFLQLNHTAKVYVQRKAFEPHYIKRFCFKFPVGLDASLREHPKVVAVDGDLAIDEELSLFTVSDILLCPAPANDSLLDAHGKDTFAHEQNLIVHGESNTLVMGCGHAGILNILRAAQPYAPKVCVGGYHLYDPASGKTAPEELLANIAQGMEQYDIRYHTCHCTGQVAYDFLAERLPHMAYLACGESIEV